MDDLDSFFAYQQDNTATGGNKWLIQNDQTSAASVRSRALFAPAYSTLCIHISAAASVVIKSNPFGDTTKDFTIKTVTTTTQEVVTSAMWIVLDISGNTGIVTAKLVPNED